MSERLTATLEEIERLANEIRAYDEWSDETCGHGEATRPAPEMPRLAMIGGKYDDAASHLARAVLAMLPVMKAAEAWRERGPGQSHCDEEDCPCTSTTCRLKVAVDQMRFALNKDTP